QSISSTSLRPSAANNSLALVHKKRAAHIASKPANSTVTKPITPSLRSSQVVTRSPSQTRNDATITSIAAEPSQTSPLPNAPRYGSRPFARKNSATNNSARAPTAAPPAATHTSQNVATSVG
ncbi:unnamed protein product, partial [Ectocarpus sp. 12 AP-2014]